MPQVKLGDAAETIGKFGLAVAIVCFVAQTVIWFVNMSRKVRARAGGLRGRAVGRGRGRRVGVLITVSMASTASRAPARARRGVNEARAGRPQTCLSSLGRRSSRE